MILIPRPVPVLRRLLATLLASFVLLCWEHAIRAQQPAPVHRTAACPAGEAATVANGVYDCLVDLDQGAGIESALRVYIDPGASGGKAQMDLRDLLEPAFYYCSGVEVPRDSGLNYIPCSSAPHSAIRFRTRSKISGSWAPSQRQIEFATASYEAVETSFLQSVSGLDKSMKIEVAFNEAVSSATSPPSFRATPSTRNCWSATGAGETSSTASSIRGIGWIHSRGAGPRWASTASVRARPPLEGGECIRCGCARRRGNS